MHARLRLLAGVHVDADRPVSVEERADGAPRAKTASARRSRGSGISPGSAAGRSGTLICGMLDISARVYGWRGRSKQLLPRRPFHDLAEVHHGHLVAHVANDGQVVRNEQVGEAEFRLQISGAG